MITPATLITGSAPHSFGHRFIQAAAHEKHGTIAVHTFER